MPGSTPGILARGDGATIAYHASAGRTPGVVFLTGFKSDMTGTKALALEESCRRRGQAFVRFDYFGHGASSGAFTDGTIGRWADDAVAVLDRLAVGPQVLVGSSMGGWIMLLAALRRPERIAGLIGIAAAPDFTEDLVPAELTAEQKAALARDGVVHLSSPYSPEPTPLTARLIEDGRNHLVLRRRIPLLCPVRLLHGMKDPDVPWQTSLRLAQMLESADVETTLVKEGDHRLSEPADLERLTATVTALLDRLAGT
jgi:pimeloyl-ACP methyl ester carboxylesterase